MGKTESIVKQTPLEIFEKEIIGRDNILPQGIHRISFNEKTYTLDERNLEKKKGVNHGK